VRWPLVTAALLIAIVAGAAWVGLRDRDVHSPPPASDGREALAAARDAAKADGCAHCEVELVAWTGGRTWRVRVHGQRPHRCLDVDLDAAGRPRPAVCR
jgi:hypothetical protein